MKPVRTIAALAGAATLATLGMVTASSAQAATTPQAVTCSGELSSGTYLSVTVNEYCQVPNGARVTVQGGITVNSNAYFDAGTQSKLTVRGDVTGAQGSMVQIGCTAAHNPCGGEEPEFKQQSGSGWLPVFSNDHINGSVVLTNVYNAAFNGVTIGGNFISNGGGAGLNSGDNGSYSIKDDVIGGNVRVWDLTTDWFGIIRSNVGGYVDLRRIKNSRYGEFGPDGNEVVANNIGQSLVCLNNSPKNQYGDAVFDGPYPGYGANIVGGRATGQCAALTQPPAPEI